MNPYQNLRIRNGESEAIPANAIARIQLGTYDTNLKCFTALKPYNDNMDYSELVSISRLILPGNIGEGTLSSIFVALSSPGNLLYPGDKAGTCAGQWYLGKISDDSFGNNDANFLIIKGNLIPDDWIPDTYYALSAIVKLDDIKYICINPHQSDSNEPWVNKPGIGSDWQAYWALTDSEQIIVRPRTTNRFFGIFDE